MDHLLPKLLSFPPHPAPKTHLSNKQYDDGINAQIDALKKTSTKHLLQRTSGGENPLEVVNPALHSAAYAHILLSHINASEKGTNTDEHKLWQHCMDFLKNFDVRQIRYAGRELHGIICYVAFAARRSLQPGIAVTPIGDAILRLDPSGSAFTSMHLILAKLAIESRQYHHAVPVLEKFILHFPGSPGQGKSKLPCDLGQSASEYLTSSNGFFAQSNITYQDVLEYFLLSGMVFIGLRDWKRALESLENAVCYNAREQATSKIMIEAYKKWVLVGLLLEGRQLPLPSTITNSTVRVYHAFAKPYESIAAIFENASASRLKAEADAGQRIWKDDCNTGLMLNVLNAYQKFQIRNLAKIYSKISIPEILSLTMSAETGAKLPSAQALEDLIRSMIADGSLSATLTQIPKSPSILTFQASAQALSETEVYAQLLTTTESIKTLAHQIKSTDRMLTYDKEYIKHAQRLKKNAKNGVADHGIAGAEMDWSEDEDEDIMGGGF